MNSSLLYCPRVTEILARLRRFYEERPQDIILAAMRLPSPALQEFARTHPTGFCAYPDPHERIAFWDAHLRQHVSVRDDSIPVAYLSEMDQGLYGGLVGGKAQFLCDPETGWISSMISPILRDWSEFEQLASDPESEWWHRYLRQLEIFTEGARGKFGISHFILIDSLNFVFELVGGTRTYVDLLERPEMVRRAVDFAYDLNVKVQTTFFEKVPLFMGGTFSNMGQWLPGRIVSESVDPFHMTSVDYFEQWGREPAERIMNRFNGGVLHIHGNGRHLLEAVSTLKGLKAVYLADDRGFPRAFEVLGQLKQRVGALPIVVGVGFPEFCQALHEHDLVGGVFYRVTDVPDLDAAHRCMDLVREYRV
ncbi:MAG: hypothetical protein IT330_14280 [Anaerolineae bacterium]|nr:hypothetical protein [Anaerolineae bacterium]